MDEDRKELAVWVPSSPHCASLPSEVPPKTPSRAEIRMQLDNSPRDDIIALAETFLSSETLEREQWAAITPVMSSLLDDEVDDNESGYDSAENSAEERLFGDNPVHSGRNSPIKGRVTAVKSPRLPPGYPLDAVQHALRRALAALGGRGVAFLLGLRCTLGSVDREEGLIPPCPCQLKLAFNAVFISEKDFRRSKRGANPRHKPPLLSHGARALSKHNHRSKLFQFWGEVTGSELSKNKQANTKLEYLLKEAVWCNIHYLPNDVPVYEVRLASGFGARWNVDGKVFRGLLEPQLEHNQKLQQLDERHQQQSSGLTTDVLHC